MTKRKEPKRRAAAYARDMSRDGKDQENLVGKERPRELEQLLEAAASEPRPFDVLLVYTRAVLGTPLQAQQVVEDFRKLGVEVQATDGSLPE